MSQVFEILPYDGRPADEIFDLILPIQREEFGIPITRADQPDLENIAGFYQKGIGNFWLALAGGKIIATTGLIDTGDGNLVMRKMFLDPAWRGKDKGVSQKLMDTVITHAKNRGATAILLGTTDKFLAAHRFYEKNEFEEVAKEDLPPTFPVMKVDSKFYCYRLR